MGVRLSCWKRRCLGGWECLLPWDLNPIFARIQRPDCPLVGVRTPHARSIQKEAQYRLVTKNDRSRSFSISNPAAKTQQRTKWSQPDIENRPNGTTTIDWLQYSTVQYNCTSGLLDVVMENFGGPMIHRTVQYVQNSSAVRGTVVVSYANVKITSSTPKLLLSSTYSSVPVSVGTLVS